MRHTMKPVPGPFVTMTCGYLYSAASGPLARLLGTLVKATRISRAHLSEVMMDEGYDWWTARARVATSVS